MPPLITLTPAALEARINKARSEAWEQGRRDGERNANLGTNEPNPYEDQA